MTQLNYAEVAEHIVYHLAPLATKQHLFEDVYVSWEVLSWNLLWVSGTGWVNGIENDHKRINLCISCPRKKEDMDELRCLIRGAIAHEMVHVNRWDQNRVLNRIRMPELNLEQYFSEEEEHEAYLTGLIEEAAARDCTPEETVILWSKRTPAKLRYIGYHPGRALFAVNRMRNRLLLSLEYQNENRPRNQNRRRMGCAVVS